jgi:demethoxyubiquinone hydroxylase (CLK1/Coq7/Cat5 family)
MTHNAVTTFSKDTVDKLTECLRGELSAVETYDMALKHVKHNEAQSTLRQIRDNHDRRVRMLRERLRSAGAEAPTTAGVWGAFAKVVQAGADLLGERAATAALEEGEDRGLKMYSEGLDRCDADTQNFIRVQLLPEQQKTHMMCRSIKQFVRAA